MQYNDDEQICIHAWIVYEVPFVGTFLCVSLAIESARLSLTAAGSGIVSIAFALPHIRSTQ